MNRQRKEKLLSRYIRLERWSEVTEVDCEAFRQIVSAVKDKDRDRLFNVIKEFSNFRVDDEEVSWIIDEAISILKDDVEHVRGFEEVQIRAKEIGSPIPPPNTNDIDEDEDDAEPEPNPEITPQKDPAI